MIAIVGQSVVDRVTAAGQRADRAPRRIAGLRRRRAGLRRPQRGDPHQGRDARAARAARPSSASPSRAARRTSSFVSALDIYGDGERHHEIAALRRAVHARRRDRLDGAAPGRLPGGRLRRPVARRLPARDAARAGRPTVGSSCSTARGRRAPQRLGPIVDEGPLDPAWVEGVTVLKCSDLEADALFGDARPGRQRHAGRRHHARARRRRRDPAVGHRPQVERRAGARPGRHDRRRRHVHGADGGRAGRRRRPGGRRRAWPAPARQPCCAGASTARSAAIVAGARRRRARTSPAPRAARRRAL